MRPVCNRQQTTYYHVVKLSLLWSWYLCRIFFNTKYCVGCRTIRYTKGRHLIKPSSYAHSRCVPATCERLHRLPRPEHKPYMQKNFMPLNFLTARRTRPCQLLRYHKLIGPDPKLDVQALMSLNCHNPSHHSLHCCQSRRSLFSMSSWICCQYCLGCWRCHRGYLWVFRYWKLSMTSKPYDEKLLLSLAPEFDCADFNSRQIKLILSSWNTFTISTLSNFRERPTPHEVGLLRWTGDSALTSSSAGSRLEDNTSDPYDLKVLI